MANSFDPRDIFVHLNTSGATTVQTGPDFWTDLMSGQRVYPGRMAMVLPMREDFAHWERHPAGEELILMLSGRCTVIIETDTGEDQTVLEAGKACLVPTGAWHRAIIHEPGEALFVTEGEGTEHRAL